MRLAKSGKTIALVLIACFCLVSMSSSADAWWGRYGRVGYYGHFGHGYYGHVGHYGHYGHYPHYGYRSFHYRPVYYGYSFAYPSYRSYSLYNSWYPVYYRTYSPRYYYVTPYVGYGCYSSWGGYGGYYSVNSVTTGRSPIAIAKTDQLVRPRLRTLGADLPATSIATSDRTAALGKIELKLSVPEDARVTINDQPTTTTGSRRTFLSNAAPLEDQYEFVVRAEIERHGKTLTETKRVLLRGGQASLLAFALEDSSTQLASADDPVTTAHHVASARQCGSLPRRLRNEARGRSSSF